MIDFGRLGNLSFIKETIKMEMKTVCVIMSTYNGEQYLCDQIDSILAQQGVEVIISIRDDGSADSTRKILEKYSSDYSNIKVAYGRNVGWKESFYKATVMAEHCDYYAFCDQDDFWKKDKLISAVSKLCGEDDSIPVLYACSVDVVDKSLNLTGKKFGTYNPNIRNDIECFVETRMAGGLTYVFNNKAKDIFVESFPYICGHDDWMFFRCKYNGKVLYDSNSFVLYRQHGTNELGVNRSLVWHFQSKLKRLKGRIPENKLLAEELLKYLSLENKDLINFLQLVANYKGNMLNKFKIINNKYFRRKKLIPTLFLYLRVLFELY